MLSSHWRWMEDVMKTLTRTTRDIATIVEVNADRLLVPLTIAGALTLAAWIASALALGVGGAQI